MGEDLTAGKGRKAQAKATDTLPVVAEHRLPHGVTSLCPAAAQGLPITAGTRKGDVFQLTLTKQVHAPRSAASTLYWRRTTALRHVSAHTGRSTCFMIAGTGSMKATHGQPAVGAAPGIA